MKIYLLLLTLLIPKLEMNEYQYELLLRKDISKINIGNYELHNSSDNFYSVSFSNKSKAYFNNSIYFLSLYTDNKKQITKVDLKLTSLIDRELYDTFVDIYGKPSMILVPDKVSYDKTTEHKKSKATVRKTIRNTKKGTFEDNPTFLIWKKDDYKLEILMKYEQGISEISFTKNEQS